MRLSTTSRRSNRINRRIVDREEVDIVEIIEVVTEVVVVGAGEDKTGEEEGVDDDLVSVLILQSLK